MISIFIRGKHTSDVCTHGRKAMWGHNGKAATCKTRREASGDTKPADTLIFDFKSPELWENRFLLFKPSSMWYFDMAALANEYIYPCWFSVRFVYTFVEKSVKSPIIIVGFVFFFFQFCQFLLCIFSPSVLWYIPI